LGPLERAILKLSSYLKRCVFSNFESGRWTKSENPVSPFDFSCFPEIFLKWSHILFALYPSVTDYCADILLQTIKLM
jgi:hypothetical protein